jgi:hypothetical protein
VFAKVKDLTDFAALELANAWDFEFEQRVVGHRHEYVRACAESNRFLGGFRHRGSVAPTGSHHWSPTVAPTGSRLCRRLAVCVPAERLARRVSGDFPTRSTCRAHAG